MRYLVAIIYSDDMKNTDLPKSMQAVVCYRYGPPSVLQHMTVARPTPKANEVLVRVVATTVNRTDCANLSAKPFIMRFVIGLLKPRKPIMGTEFSGVVVAAGDSVSRFKAGDRVFGFNDTTLSSYAEYLTLPDDKPIAMVPENMTLKCASASIEGAHYAYNCINKIKLKTGQRALLNGATGGIGSALLQMLKLHGVYVTAVGDSKNIDLLKSLNADRIIDYTKTDFCKVEHEPYDYIFDSVGKSSFGKSKHLLLPGGIYMSSELGDYAQNLFYPIFTKFFGNKKVIFPIPGSIVTSLNYIVSLIERNEFTPIIDREYPLKNIEEAFDYVSAGKKTGNVIINISSID